MKTMDIYTNATNPIDNSVIFDKIMELYSKSDNGLYSKLVSANQTIDSEKFSIKDSDEFYAMLFNKWKNSIVSMTKEEYKELYKKGSYKKDFIKLRNFLKTVEDVKTKKEAFEILFSEREDKELENAIDNYRWSAFGEGSGWEHITSRQLHAKKENSIDVRHRLYLNIDSLGIYKFCKCFIEKCEKGNLPYYFKFTMGSNRDDSVVVYSSTENLNKYIDILNTIKKENQELDKYINKPPILTVPVDNWIGYGGEPVCKRGNGRRYSFNLLRANILENVIKQTTADWIKEHKDMMISFNGKKVRFSDYILMSATNDFVNYLKQTYDYYKEIFKRRAVRENKPFNEKEVIDHMGYTKEDIDNQRFKENIYQLLIQKKDMYMDAIITGQYDKIQAFPMKVRNNKQIYFGRKNINETVNKLSLKIKKFDSSYTEKIKAGIKEVSPSYGIDPNNFSFDTKRVEDLKYYDEYIETITKKEELKEISPAKQIQKPRPRDIHETNEEYLSYLRSFYSDESKKELSDMLKKEVAKPRPRSVHETDEEYERYLSEFYNEGSSKK